MRFVLFYHSLISDWNHGNAHFLRGIATELQAQGHRVDVFEPANGWSLRNLKEQEGWSAVEAFHEAYPTLQSSLYDPDDLDLEQALDGADVVLVHEWNTPDLVSRIGQCRASGGRFKLLFHDTHHRAVSEPDAIQRFDLRHFDGVLAFGEVLRQIYEERGWAARAWTWHEAADVRRFKPSRAPKEADTDLVWVGNWGEGERAAEIEEFLIEPVVDLGLRARIHGVRYPESARQRLQEARIDYRGWIANFRVPEVFARASFTVHIPRRFYAGMLPGIPTIRMFEALACGIPLISAPWNDCENLFRPGRDYLVASNGREMREHLRLLQASPDAARTIAELGLQTILERHTCAHRVAELLSICESLESPETRPDTARPAPRMPAGQAAVADVWSS